MGLGLASAVVGCADDKSKTDLLGTPDILQVMVLVPAGLRAAIQPWSDPRSGYSITYEQAMPFGGNVAATSDYAACSIFNNGGDDEGGTLQGAPTTLCQEASIVKDCVCPEFNGMDGVCQMSGDLIGRCVDPLNVGFLPMVTGAQAEAPSIRVVVGDLIDEPTVEHFACACQGTQLDDLHVGSCTGPAWADPTTCNTCGTSATDSSAQGRCLDTDSNGLPDFSSLIAGVYTLTCTLPAGGACPTGLDGWSGTGTNCVYTATEGSGYVYISGNQFQSSVTGLAGIGPAVVLSPSTALPTSASCVVALNDSIKDQEGKSYRLGALIPGKGTSPTFVVQDLTFDLGAPADTVDITNDTHLVVEVDAIAPLTAATLTADVLDVNTSDTQNATNSSPDLSGGDTAVSEFAGIQLIENHLYVVTITGSGTNEFGSQVEFGTLTTNTTATVTTMAKK